MTEEERKEYFESMRQVVRKCREKHEELPYTRGAMLVLRAYEENERLRSSRFEVEDMPKFRNEAEEFVKVLRHVGIDEFAITEQSTYIIRILHRLETLGWVFNGLCRVKRTYAYMGKNIGDSFVEAIIVKYCGKTEVSEGD